MNLENRFKPRHILSLLPWSSIVGCTSMCPITWMVMIRRYRRLCGTEQVAHQDLSLVGQVENSACQRCWVRTLELTYPLKDMPFIGLKIKWPTYCSSVAKLKCCEKIWLLHQSPSAHPPLACIWDTRRVGWSVICCTFSSRRQHLLNTL